jgi:hypothetical protein
MKRLVLESWLLLVYFDVMMRLRNFDALISAVRGCKTGTPMLEEAPSVAALCNAVDLACVFYFKKVMCLQRSAATALLLRRYGAPAEMVIGAQILPFKSHAWVEVDGTIVNDKPYMLDIYQVLERC